MMKNEVVYNDGELELKVPVNSDTIWLKSENSVTTRKLIVIK